MGVSNVVSRGSTSSLPSISSSIITRGSGGVEGCRRPAFFRERALVVRVKIEPAQDFTFLFFFFLIEEFLLADRCPHSMMTGGVSCPDDEFAMSEDLDIVPVEWELSGRDLVGEPETANGSLLNNDHLFGVLAGLRLAGEPESPCGRLISNGMEFRLRGDCGSPSSVWIVCVRSKIAPAVLGRDPLFLLEAGESGAVGVSRSGPLEFVMEAIDETLPEPECPGRTVTVLPVSVEITDSGRGINSRVSENPTRARAVGFVSILISGVGGSVAAMTGSWTSAARIAVSSDSDFEESLLISGKDPT